MAVNKDDFPWLSHYPKGVPYELNPEAYPSLIELINEGFEKFENQPAYTYMDKMHTFGQIKVQAYAFAAYLQSLGLKTGDRIALQLPNCTQYPVVLYGSLLAGLVVVNTNPLYTPREMKHQFTDSGAKAIVILANFAFNLEKVIGSTDIKHVIVTELGDMLGFPKKQIVNFVVKNIKKMVPPHNLQGTVSFSEAISRGMVATYKKPKVNINDLALIQYTGGTTGVSKGAELTHRNLIANMEGITLCFTPALKHDHIERTILGALPFYHIFALTVNVFSSLKLGFHNILIPNPRDQKALLKDLKKHKLFIFPGLNTLFNSLLNNPEFTKLDFSNLKITVSGGMALQVAIAEKWAKVTGCNISEGYGLSETSPVLSVNPVGGGQQLGTIGLPFPSTIMKILKDDGTWGGPNETGEICAHGPQVMRGYYNRPDETEKVFLTDPAEGKKYFKTGDIGLMQEDGFFKIVDRKKDMILISGFNVYPNEIEEVIAQHPGVLEVACVGVEDEKSSEAVKIFVVKKDPNLTEADLHAYSKENFTGYKRPKYIEFRTELPKTNVGKILRRELRDEKK
jgi:long-chain acyl-CoA synthetase